MLKRLTALILLAAPWLPLPVFADARALIDEAEALQRQARGVNHAWVMTGRRIGEAKSALASGDEASAEQLAAEAVRLARESLTQAETEASTWRKRVPVAP